MQVLLRAVVVAEPAALVVPEDRVAVRASALGQLVPGPQVPQRRDHAGYIAESDRPLPPLVTAHYLRAQEEPSTQIGPTSAKEVGPILCCLRLG
ncbi:hypothetical protein RHRU231_450248 [Rhodococcus ruber]|uniref:Uncharacterized protein n=1 Tax=Rhodococcus ruber TaxID=1830 RepID=A0A098BMY7_9NOCA|nr:hypothetical protein RHRU231_450248 [Rhodococcus ruber]